MAKKQRIRKTNKLPLKATVQRQSGCQGPTGNNVSVSRAVILDNMKGRKKPVARSNGATPSMTAAELADMISPVFQDLSVRRHGSWTPAQKKAWNKAVNALQLVRGRSRKDPL